MGGVALKHDMALKELKKLNSLFGTSQLYPGQVTVNCLKFSFLWILDDSCDL